MQPICWGLISAGAGNLLNQAIDDGFEKSIFVIFLIIDICYIVHFLRSVHTSMLKTRTKKHKVTCDNSYLELKFSSFYKSEFPELLHLL